MGDVEDLRCGGKVEHRLTDILIIAVCAVIACAESLDDIALYGRNKLPWLKTFLPSHDTFRRVFMLIDPATFEAVFLSWVGTLVDDFDREVVAIGGTTVRRSFDRGRVSDINAVNSGLRTDILPAFISSVVFACARRR